MTELQKDHVESAEDTQALVFIEKITEHLRTVHFTILATVFSLLVANSLLPTTSLNQAIKQVYLLMQVQKDLSNLASINKNDLPSWAKRYLRREDLALILPPDGHGFALDFSDKSLNSAVVIYKKSDKNNKKTTNRGDAIYLSLYINNFWPQEKTKTLAGFRKSWNETKNDELAHLEPIGQGKLISIMQYSETNKTEDLTPIDITGWKIYQNPKAVGPPTNSQNVKFDSADIICHQEYIRCELIMNSENEKIIQRFNRIIIDISINGITSKDSLSIFSMRNIMESDESDIFDQSSISPQENRDQWLKSIRQKPFEQAFPDLSLYLTSLGSMNLNEVHEKLRKKQIDVGNDIELYGVKVPQTGLAVWGVAVLAIMQIYFLTHLLQLKLNLTKQRTPYQAPWIALYPNLLPSILTQMAIAAPAATGFILISNRWSSISGFNQFLCVIAQAISIAAAIYIILSLRAVKSHLAMLKS
ncbi:hypothetical protein [Rhodoferax sp.]|uniref:hypothetical protein n=1 Tax=Rhodoferax sp. TaxID=50421 RepID=UPI00374C971C